MHALARGCIVLLCCLFNNIGFTAPQFGKTSDMPLLPDEAFIVTAAWESAATLAFHWQVAPGHYLYRDKFRFAIQEGEATLGQAIYPDPHKTTKSPHGEALPVYAKDITITVPVKQDKPGLEPMTVVVSYQGCAEKGYCYPPLQKTITITPAPAVAAAQWSEEDKIAGLLTKGELLKTLFTFFIIGMGLALTPCVLPMVPILSSIIVGKHHHHVHTWREFSLSVVYVLAMALTYSGLGVATGLAGNNLQVIFQTPWIILSISGLFLVLALSMFGLFEIKAPHRLEQALNDLQRKPKGGAYLSVAFMGVLSSLVVSPCITPALAGTLLYIGRVGDPWLGGISLFVMGLGMGVPLLIIGTSMGKFLRKANQFSEQIKNFFGVLLLGTAIWMLQRILPGSVTLLLWGGWLMIGALFLGAFSAVETGVARVFKGLGLLLFVYGVLLVLGAGLGGTDPIRPLEPLSGTIKASFQNEIHTPKNLTSLKAELDAAKNTQQPVLIDFYADWCVSCQVIEQEIILNQKVRARLSAWRIVKIDITKNTIENQEIMKEFGVIAPPTLLFFNAVGKEMRALRVTGSLNLDEFLQKAEGVDGLNAVSSLANLKDKGSILSNSNAVHE